MATVAAITFTLQSGTDAITYSTGSFTPTANDLLLVSCGAQGSTATDWVLTDSVGGTYTKIGRSLYTASADILEMWVGNSLAAASARTLTYSHAAGVATGGFIQAVRVAGMTRTGSSAVRGFGVQDNQASASTPAPVLSAAALTGNPVVSTVGNATNPAAVTVPASFTIRHNLGHTAPVRGMTTASRDSGHTSATVTWGGTSASAFGSFVVELDTSALVSAPTPPRTQARYGWR